MTKQRYWLFGAVTIVLLILILTFTFRTGPAVAPATDTASSTGLFPTGATRPGNTAKPTDLLLVGSTTTNLDNEPTPARAHGRLMRLTSRPIGGANFTGTATSSALVYADKGTGHFYRLGTPGTNPERLANTTNPKVSALLAGPGAASSTVFVVQRLMGEQIETATTSLILGNNNLGETFLGNNIAPASLTFQSLGPNIESVVASPDHRQLFWLETGLTGARGHLAKFVGGKPELIFSSPLREWRAAWVNDNTIALLTKTGQNYPGALFLLNPKTKALTAALTEISGLTALVSPKLDRILYSAANGNQLLFGFYEPAKQIFGRLAIATWVDKCLWKRDGTLVYCAVPSTLPSGAYPDDWYRGEIVTNDSWWRLNPATGQAEILWNVESARLGVRLDAENLFLNPAETILYFTNRADGNLWAFNLVGEF